MLNTLYSTFLQNNTFLATSPAVPSGSTIAHAVAELKQQIDSRQNNDDEDILMNKMDLLRDKVEKALEHAKDLLEKEEYAKAKEELEKFTRCDHSGDSSVHHSLFTQEEFDSWKNLGTNKILEAIYDAKKNNQSITYFKLMSIYKSMLQEISEEIEIAIEEKDLSTLSKLMPKETCNNPEDSSHGLDNITFTLSQLMEFVKKIRRREVTLDKMAHVRLIDFIDRLNDIIYHKNYSGTTEVRILVEEVIRLAHLLMRPDNARTQFLFFMRGIYRSRRSVRREQVKRMHRRIKLFHSLKVTFASIQKQIKSSSINLRSAINSMIDIRASLLALPPNTSTGFVERINSYVSRLFHRCESAIVNTIKDDNLMLILKGAIAKSNGNILLLIDQLITLSESNEISENHRSTIKLQLQLFQKVFISFTQESTVIIDLQAALITSIASTMNIITIAEAEEAQELAEEGAIDAENQREIYTGYASSFVNKHFSHLSDNKKALLIIVIVSFMMDIKTKLQISDENYDLLCTCASKSLYRHLSDKHTDKLFIICPITKAKIYITECKTDSDTSVDVKAAMQNMIMKSFSKHNKNNEFTGQESSTISKAITATLLT